MLGLLHGAGFIVHSEHFLLTGFLNKCDRVRTEYLEIGLKLHSVFLRKIPKEDDDTVCWAERANFINVGW